MNLTLAKAVASVCKQGEMEGSKQYRQREQEAANMWQASEAHKRNLDALAAPVQRIQEILALPIDITRLQQVWLTALHSGPHLQISP